MQFLGQVFCPFTRSGFSSGTNWSALRSELLTFQRSLEFTRLEFWLWAAQAAHEYPLLGRLHHVGATTAEALGAAN